MKTGSASIQFCVCFVCVHACVCVRAHTHTYIVDLVYGICWDLANCSIHPMFLIYPSMMGGDGESTVRSHCKQVF